MPRGLGCARRSTADGLRPRRGLQKGSRRLLQQKPVAGRLARPSQPPVAGRQETAIGEALGDRLLLEEATAAFLEAAARVETVGGAAARAAEPARHLPQHQEVPA